MSEQAESALESGSLDDLAFFLADTPEESVDEVEAQDAEESTGEADTETEANDNSEESADPEESGEEEEAAPVEKITVKVKGEDGSDETLELTPEDIAASYLRQKDYTKKTQALAQRENEAVQFLQTKHEEIRNQYLSQAELSRAAIVQMAGIKTESELAELANSDPAAWVAEQQRQRQISNYLNQLDQQINGEKQQAQQLAMQRAEQAKQAQFQKAWEELPKAGIDKPKLAKIYEQVNKGYGFSAEELGNVYDHRLVLMMKDAAAYRELKAQKSTVTKKVQDAPRMPSKQSNPAQERRDKALDSRFKGGRAKLSDLAAYLN